MINYKDVRISWQSFECAYGDQTFKAITSVTQAQSYSIHSGHLKFTCLQNAKNRFQIFTSWVFKSLSFRVVYFQFMALLFLHSHLSVWFKWFFCLHAHIFSWHQGMRECLAKTNFIWMENLRFFFIVKWHGRNIWVYLLMFCSEELLFSIAGRCPGAQSTFLLQSVNSRKTDSPGKTIRHTMINQESMTNKQN